MRGQPTGTTAHLPEYLVAEVQNLIALSNRLGHRSGLVSPIKVDMTRAEVLAKDVKEWSRRKDLSIYEEAASLKVDVWDLLELRDPSPRNLAGQICTELDALGRQLYAHDVNLNSTTVELFMSGQAAILMPALVTRWLREGQQLAGGGIGLWAIDKRVNSMTATPFHIEAASAAGDAALSPQNTFYGKRMGAVGESGHLPVVRIGYRDKDVKLGTYGIDLQTDYKAVKYMSMTELRLIFLFIGMQLIYDQLDNIFTLIVSGDGDTGAPPSYLQISGGGGAGALVHADLVQATVKLGANGMMVTHWIGGINELTDFLNLSQLTGANYRDNPIRSVLQNQRRGPIQTDYGILLPALAGTADYLCFMDSMFAVARCVEQPLMVENDKLIGELHEEVAISETVAYYKWLQDGSGYIDYSA